jgi:FKBP-type peptidyl-prolyl cis-trans isomerase FklB
MKKIIFGTVLSLGLASVVMAEGTNVVTNALSDTKSRVSYAIGLNIGHSFKAQDMDVDVDLVTRGIKDVTAGQPELMTEAEVKQTLTAFQQEMRAKMQQKRAEMGLKSKAEGEAFLAANKNQPGVTVLPDGLQYLVITNGSGAIPTASDTVTVNYKGTLIDGTEFDSSYKRGQPASFQVGGVIRGWTEALEKMTVGSKWKLFIPSNLAYGEQGQRGIPPNSVLIFEVELLDTKSPATPMPAQPLTSDIIKVPSAQDLKNGAKIEVIPSEAAGKATNGAK